jgi:transcriptional regulator with GAF, ATPase, and Fis domain
MSDSDEFLEHWLPGDAPALRALRRTIHEINLACKVRPTMARAVLLLGETGVGKNYIARVISGHLTWLRNPTIWKAPGHPSKSLTHVTARDFAEVALPNIPDNLIESELFGHMKGAFTGAEKEKLGFFASEDIRDLLLDEIGDAPPRLQVALLRVLNDRSYRRVGAAPEDVQVTEVRVLLATNRDLARMVKTGEFREDLFWRMQHLVVRIPPLREQPDYIPELAQHLLSRIRRDNDLTEPLALHDEDLSWAKGQPWRGNVRELERLIWRWAFEGGKRRLPEIQSEYGDLELTPGLGTIEAILRVRIEDALRNGTPLASSVGELAKSLTQEAQAALYRLRRTLPLEIDQLDQLFGNGKAAAHQISEWKKLDSP